MKTINLALVLFFMLGMSVSGQVKRQENDTVSFERDTIIKYYMENKGFKGSWYVYVDTLSGVKTGTVELVVANDINYQLPLNVYPADSLFSRVSTNMVYTLAAPGPYVFNLSHTYYTDWVGLRFKKGGTTKWYMNVKMIAQLED